MPALGPRFPRNLTAGFHAVRREKSTRNLVAISARCAAYAGVAWLAFVAGCSSKVGAEAPRAADASQPGSHHANLDERPMTRVPATIVTPFDAWDTRQLFETGRTLYDAGNMPAAAERFEAAFVHDPEGVLAPPALFNAGLAREANQELEKKLGASSSREGCRWQTRCRVKRLGFGWRACMLGSSRQAGAGCD